MSTIEETFHHAAELRETALEQRIAELEEIIAGRHGDSCVHRSMFDAATAAKERAEREAERLSAMLNTPELHDFAKAVVLEAAHQRERWGSDHDAGKAPADWFWLVGYLAGKALAAHLAGNADKALHHTVSAAAALANWHAAIDGSHTQMRPGIAPPKGAP